MDNLKYYELGRAVPKEAQKEFNNGKFSGTDINPMWRIKKLTEMFGPAGFGWCVKDVTERCEDHGDMTIAVVTLNLYVCIDGKWSEPIYGTGGNVVVRKGNVSDEGYKMAYTDALSVACKALGIGADIYFGKDKTKYTEYAVEEKPAAKATPKAAPVGEKPKGRTATAAQLGIIRDRYRGKMLEKLLAANGIERVEDLPMEKASELCAKIAEMDKKREEASA